MRLAECGGLNEICLTHNGTAVLLDDVERGAHLVDGDCGWGFRLVESRIPVLARAECKLEVQDLGHKLTLFSERNVWSVLCLIYESKEFGLIGTSGIAGPSAKRAGDERDGRTSPSAAAG